MRSLILFRIAPMLALCVFTQGCGESDPTTPVGTGGNAGTGGTSNVAEPPDYEKAFPQDSVPRLDITISPENWGTMVADITDMLGEFGANSMGGGMGGMIPPEAIAACDGLTVGDGCSMTIDGNLNLWVGSPSRQTTRVLFEHLGLRVASGALRPKPHAPTTPNQTLLTFMPLRRYEEMCIKSASFGVKAKESSRDCH